MMDDQNTLEISAKTVTLDNRLNFLPAFFGVHLMLVGEATVYGWMERLSSDYQGGYWEFKYLSNGGYYMHPTFIGTMKLSVHGNGFDGEVSADAAGIIATLFALGQLAEQFSDERLVDLYYWLREYAQHHPESASIYRAIN